MMTVSVFDSQQEMLHLRSMVTKLTECLFEIVHVTHPSFDLRLENLEKDLRKELSSHREELSSHHNELSSLREQLSSHRKDVTERLSDIQCELSNQNYRLESLRYVTTQSDPVKKNLTALKERVASETSYVKLVPDHGKFSYAGLLVSLSGSVLSGNIAGSDMISEFTIPATVEEISDGFFREWNSLSRVRIANGSRLKRIGENAFSDCPNLDVIEIPASLERIGSGWFSGGSMANVTFGKGSCLKSIGANAFTICDRMNRLEIPASVEEIGENCFHGSSLESISFENEGHLKRIGKSAFGMCRNLKTIDVPWRVEYLDDMCFSDCASLCCVRFARESILKRIGKRAFSGCRGLKEIEIPASAEVDEMCFGDAGTYIDEGRRRGTRLLGMGSQWALDEFSVSNVVWSHEIGRGAFGRVYSGFLPEYENGFVRHPRTDVAVKVLKYIPGSAAIGSVDCMKRISHPSVIRFYGYDLPCNDDDHFKIVMGSVSQILRELFRKLNVEYFLA